MIATNATATSNPAKLNRNSDVREKLRISNSLIAIHSAVELLGDQRPRTSRCPDVPVPAASRRAFGVFLRCLLRLDERLLQNAIVNGGKQRILTPSVAR